MMRSKKFIMNPLNLKKRAYCLKRIKEFKMNLMKLKKRPYYKIKKKHMILMKQ